MALRNAITVRLSPAQAAYLDHLVATGELEVGDARGRGHSSALRAILDDHLREQVRRGHAPDSVRALWAEEADAEDLDYVTGQQPASSSEDA